MQYSVAKFPGFGTFYYRGQVWSPKWHVGRVSETAAGRFAAYDKQGNLLGVCQTRRDARLLVVG
jgi:hypothetical protein